MKIKRIDMCDKKHEFICVMGPNTEKSQYYTISTKTGFSILIEPYIKMDSTILSSQSISNLNLNPSMSEESLDLGTKLFDLLKNNLKIKDEKVNDKLLVCDVKPFDSKENKIYTAKSVYVWTKDVFNADEFFKKIKYISKNYKTDTYKIIDIVRVNNAYENNKGLIHDVNNLSLGNDSILENNKKPIFYEVNNKTTVHFTNIMPFSLYGYEKNEKKITEKIYATLFERERLEEHKLPIKNIIILKGTKEVRLEELPVQISKNLKVNSITIDFYQKIVNSGVSNDCIKILKDLQEKKHIGPTIVILKNCFNKSIVDFKILREFITNNKQFVYFLLVNKKKDAHEIIEYFENEIKFENIDSQDKENNSIQKKDEKTIDNNIKCEEIEVFEIEVPIIDDINLLRNIINTYKNDFNSNTMRELFRLCKGYRLNIIESIIRDTISKVQYNSSNLGKLKKLPSNKVGDISNVDSRKLDSEFQLSFNDVLGVINERNKKKSSEAKVGIFRRIYKKIFGPKMN